MIAHIITVLCCFWMDQCISILFPSSFLLQQMILIPSLGFCAILITVRKFDFISSILFAVLMGFVYELIFTQTFMIYPIVYAICILLLKFWSKQVGYSIIESSLLCIILVFVKELLVYLWMLFINATNLALINWMTRILLPSLLLNLVLVFVIFGIIHLKDEFLERKNLRIKKEESLTFDVFKQKR